MNGYLITSQKFENTGQNKMGTANFRPLSSSLPHDKPKRAHIKRQLFNKTTMSGATQSQFKNNQKNFKLLSLGISKISGQNQDTSESDRSNDIKLTIPRFGETKSSVYSNIKLSSQHPKNHNFTFSIFQNPYQNET